MVSNREIMRLTQQQLQQISSVIRRYNRFGYIPEFATFMDLLNDKKFNELIKKNLPISELEEYLLKSTGRFCFKSVSVGDTPDTIQIFYHLGNRGLYPEYEEILSIPETPTQYGITLTLYYKES